MDKSAYKPKGYWSNFAHVEEAVQTFLKGHETQGMMPTAKQLNKSGYNSLTNAIQKHGGFPAVAERLGLVPTSTAKPKGYWDQFTHVEHELRTFMKKHSKGKMPTSDELAKAGHSSLVAAIYKHGGTAMVAKRLGLELSFSKKPNGHWDEFANVEKAIRTFIEEHGTPGVMPTLNRLRKADLYNLVHAIYKYGGFSAVAQRLGLSYTGPEQITAHIVSTVEQLARSIDVQATILSPYAGLMDNEFVVKAAANCAAS